MALEQTDLSPRELAVRFTDEKRYFVSEAVYRLLKAHDLITSPAYTVIKYTLMDEFLGVDLSGAWMCLDSSIH